MKDQAMNLAAQLASKANCDGHRGELALIETAKAIAAMDDRKYVNVEDLKEASELALPHRMKDIPPKQNQEQTEMEPPKDENNDNKEDEHKEEENKDNKQEESSDKDKQSDNYPGNNDEDNNDEDVSNTDSPSNLLDETFDIGKIFKVKKLNIKVRDRKERCGSGKRTKTNTNALQGRYIRYKESRGDVRDLAFDATIRAAAPYQKFRKHIGNTAISICKQDIKEKVREKRTGATIVFVVDASRILNAVRNAI